MLYFFRCRGQLPSILAISGVILLFCTGVVSYAFCINRHPTKLKKWVSTVSILVTHLQTVNIIQDLRVHWPSSVDTAFSILVVNGLQLEAARPECLIDTRAEGSEDFPFYHVFNIVKVACSTQSC